VIIENDTQVMLSKRARITKDDSITDTGERQYVSHEAPDALTSPPPNRPWLTHQQNISEQNLWLIYCRDNFVPGATDVKDWPIVTSEFNAYFVDVLKISTNTP
jgi:hypothetical protein